MGFTAAAFSSLRKRVDLALRASFPAELVIGSLHITASSPGGKTVSEYLEGGESENFRIPFRVPRAACPTGWAPLKGASLDWVISPAETMPLEIIEVSIRPSEDTWAIACRRRRA